MTLRAKLNKTTIEALRPQAKAYTVLDTHLPGFEVVVHPTGRKVFYVYYRADGVRRRPALGEYHPTIFNTEDARHKAANMLIEVRAGKDPSAERQDARRVETFGQFAEMYLQDAKSSLAEASWNYNNRQVERVLLPAWGSKKLTIIRPLDVAELIRSVKQPREVTVKARNSKKTYKKTVGGPIAANRMISLIKAMFNRAVKLELVTAAANPARDLEKEDERERRPEFTADQVARLAQAIADEEAKPGASPWVIAAIRLLIFTGARRSEILTLKWNHVDADAQCLRLSKSKTGPKVIRLSAPALEILTKLYEMRDDSGWVIRGHKAGTHLKDPKRAWKRICESAGLPETHLHDLRHLFGETGAAIGLGLTAVGKMLGHTQARTTLRYSGMAPDPLQEAAEKIGNALLSAMEKGRVKVVEIGDTGPQAGKTQGEAGVGLGKSKGGARGRGRKGV